MRVLSVLSAAVLVPFAFGQLNSLIKAKGKLYFGSATDNGELSDAPYKAILSDTTEFGQITAGNSQKWDATERSQNVFSYANGDVISALAKTNGQLLRCHTLVWHSQLPSWVSSGTWTSETLIAVMKNHIANLVTHYKGQCYAWDVVNEALNEDGTYRVSPFSTIIGPEYIPIAFATAAQYDPDVKLYYNDYNLEYGSAKWTAAMKIVSDLKARGIKIDGAGLQAHLIVGSTPSLTALTSVLKGFTALGVEVTYTELDIRHSTLPPSAAAITQQSTDYVNVVGSCLAMPGCVGVTIWDYTDKYSWIPSVFPGAGAALLWDENLVKKAPYYAVQTLLGGGSSSTSTTTTVSSTQTTLVISTTKTSSLSTSSTTKSSTTRTTSSRTSSTRKVPTTSSSSSKITTSSSKTTTTSASGGGSIPKWGQCGGISWSGSGTCVAGSICKYQNDWYSQCL